jgi:tetratricopeptide (TPR) repeat protein
MSFRLRSFAPILPLAGAALWLTSAAHFAAVNEAELWRERNLGKAFYENPTTGPEAVAAFKKALDLAPDSFRERLNYALALIKAGDAAQGVAELEKAQKQRPEIPHTWFNLGVAFKKMGEYPKAIVQFERMVRLAPDEPVSHFNLGVLYNMAGREQEALTEFRTASRLDPKLVAPYFQIYNVHRLAGREKEGAEALAAFLKAKERQKQFDESEDMEWSVYSEIYDPVEANPALPDAAPAPLSFETQALGMRDPAGAAAFDYDGDGHPDLVAWSANTVEIYRRGRERADAGLPRLSGITSVAVGDFNDDGLADLAVSTVAETVLLENRQGRFVRAGAALPPAAKCVWLDYDHDADLDLFLLGEHPALFRNQGAKGFVDVTASFPFAGGQPLDAVPFRLLADGKGLDLAVSHAGRPGVLYSDGMRGQYTAEPLVPLPAGARNLTVDDVNGDGWFDIAFATQQSAGVLVNRSGKFDASALPGAAAGVVSVDLENRGVPDIVAGAVLFRKFRRAAAVPGLRRPLEWADFDGDGRADLAGAGADGALVVLFNRIQNRNHWVAVNLQGVKNPKLAPASEVEIKAGPLYRKQPYRGVPVLFGLGSQPVADTVRVTWPNGMIQNLPDQRPGQVAQVKEAPRLSGSCPMIFTWNGSRFDFLTDVLGVAPLGASAGDGHFFPVDHDEYVTIPGERLRPRDGAYEIRITEELREVSYLDRISLIAVDHPAGLEIVTNDKFHSPPFPEFRLFGVRERIRPRQAWLERAGGPRADVLRSLLGRDAQYAEGFERNASGVAGMHSLELDFGAAAPDGRAVLILNGWVDWADGSTFLNASQQGGLVMPYLEVQDPQGRWRRVVEETGIPAGKPKTIAVDLTGKFLSTSRKVRITTNLCLYWDEIYLSENAAAPPVRMTTLDVAGAALAFRGFSKPHIHPSRRQPEWFDYTQVSATSLWNPTPGLYTRYGDVRELVRAGDDRLAIMGSGDELRLRFEAAGLPAPAPGFGRDFLLLVEGWAKDGDANTAFPETVEPLPFRAMTSYPYPAGENFPDGPAFRAWRREYNTRPALRLIRPLAPARASVRQSTGGSAN